jgi:hypothetical protein
MAHYDFTELRVDWDITMGRGKRLVVFIGKSASLIA